MYLNNQIGRITIDCTHLLWKLLTVSRLLNQFRRAVLYDFYIRSALHHSLLLFILILEYNNPITYMLVTHCYLSLLSYIKIPFAFTIHHPNLHRSCQFRVSRIKLRTDVLIGHFHDDDIWLQLPEFISFLLCYWNLSIPLRIKEQ